MTYPSSDVDTLPLDAGTDSPAAARPSLLDLAQKFNLLRSHISTFWQGVLATSSQAAARSALGAVGTADTIAEATHAATADSADSAAAVPWTGVSGRPTAVSAFTNDAGYVTGGFGIGQTWQIKTSSRSLNIEYLNGTGNLIVIRVNINSTTGAGEILVKQGESADWISLGEETIGGAVGAKLSHEAHIPIGAYYKVVSDGTLIRWMELRA